MTTYNILNRNEKSRDESTIDKLDGQTIRYSIIIIEGYAVKLYMYDEHLFLENLFQQFNTSNLITNSKTTLQARKKN